MQDSDKSKAELIKEIDALRQRTADLEAMEERFLNLFEHAGDSVFIVDPVTFKILDANSSASHHLGYAHDELLDLTLDDIEVLTYDDFPGPVAWESTFSGTRVYECSYRRKDGVKIPVEVSSQIVTVSKQRVLQNFVRDISKRKQIEAYLKDAHDRLYTLSRIDAELMRRLDVHYILALALDAAVRLSSADTSIIGLVEGENIRLVRGTGRYVNQIGTLLSPDSGIVMRVLRQREAELVLDVRSDPDYTARLSETRAQMTLPLISHDHLLGVLNLETRNPNRFTPETFEFIKLLVARVAAALDNARAYETLERMVEDLDAFSHTVAHDLKNPLNTMLGYATLLVEDQDRMSSEDIQDYSEAIITAARKMNNIIDELLLLASVRTLDEVETGPLDMPLVVISATERLYDLINKYNADIRLLDHESWPVAISYAPWIEEVWANYISNAIKYGGTPPIVEVGAALQADGMIRCWVRDNGPGIQTEKQPLLFTPFKRLDGTRARGHGLGLSIVQRIMQKLGGEAGVESTPGQGCLFYFTLPAR